VHVLNVLYAQKMPLWRRMVSFWRYQRSVVRLGKRLQRPDVVYACSTPPSVAAAGHRLAKHFGVPWVFEAIDVWPQVPIGMGLVPPLIGRFAHRYVDRLYKSAAHVFALSPGMAQQIRDRGVSAHKVTASFNGTDLARFRPRTAPASTPNQAQKPVQFVYAGALGRANAICELCEAFQAAFAGSSTKAHLTIYGFGAQVEALGAWLSAHPDAPITARAPLPKAELAHVLPHFDVGVVYFAPYPVLAHNSANKFYDYLACGLPVVLNYSGWQADFVEEHQCGWWAETGDGAGFQRRLLEAALTIRRPAMALRARDAAVQHFDRRGIAANVLARLQQLVSASRALDV